MNAAIEHFSAGWHVEDVHGTESFDLRCWRDGVELHVEVKGTTSSGRSVLMTPSEVDHARQHPAMALFVLADIVVERDEDGRVTRAAGGVPSVYLPWQIDDGELHAIGYEYSMPASD